MKLMLACLYIADEPETCEMPDEADWTDAQRAAQMNAVTFGALYLSHGQKNLGMTRHAEWGLEDGVEVDYDMPEEQRRAKTNVPPAAVWIMLAGEQIHDHCKQGDATQERGLNLRRWSLWKRKFGEIAEHQGLASDVKDWASKAASEMDKIEQ